MRVAVIAAVFAHDDPAPRSRAPRAASRAVFAPPTYDDRSAPP